MTRTIGLTATGLFVLTVWLANLLISRYGVVPVGFGLLAPAGVYAAGVAFTLRDLVHRTLGRWWVVGAIVAGGSLSYLISPAFAFASAAAFLVSEIADLAVYTPLEHRTFVGAVLLSNTVGLVIDSWLFLTLAFHSTEFLPGQIVGKAWMTLAALPVVYGLRRVRVA